jgi:hypothetical protein
MGRQCREIQIQAITGEDRSTSWGQPLLEIMHHRVGSVLGARTEMQHRDEFREGIEHNPQPTDVRVTPKAGAEFVQLEMGKMQVAKPAVVQGRAVLAGSGQPGGNRACAVPKDPHGCGDTEPFGQRGQDCCDPLGLSFEAIERRVAAGREGRPAGLAAKGLDALSLAMRPIADEGMDVGISDLVLRTGRVGTSEAVRHNAFWCPTSALQLTPRLHHGRRWRYGLR